MSGEIATSAKIACLRREIAMRERVYPGWVRAGRMREADADREIAVMKAILADYMDRLALPLFPVPLLQEVPDAHAGVPFAGRVKICPPGQPLAADGHRVDEPGDVRLDDGREHLGVPGVEDDHHAARRADVDGGIGDSNGGAGGEKGGGEGRSHERLSPVGCPDSLEAEGSGGEGGFS